MCLSPPFVGTGDLGQDVEPDVVGAQSASTDPPAAPSFVVGDLLERDVLADLDVAPGEFLVLLFPPSRLLSLSPSSLCQDRLCPH